MQDSPKSPSKRGGARPGAGRKSSPDARNIRASFNLSPRAADALRRAADAQSCSRNDIITRLLEGLSLPS